MFGSARFFMDWKLQTDDSHLLHGAANFMTLGEDKKGWKLMTRINDVSKDYPLGLKAGVWYCFSLDIILKFFKAATLEFSNSPTQILMIFLSRETVGRVTQTKYFLEMTALAKVAKNFFFLFVWFKLLILLLRYTASIFTNVFDKTTLKESTDVVPPGEFSSIFSKECFFFHLTWRICQNS